MQSWNPGRSIGLTLIFIGLSSSVYAVDGVILIDQNRASSGSITPGDLPGFPISITQPGSYRLSGNITVAATTINAFEISASNVTLDLNGFHISGPAPTCSDIFNPACKATFGVSTLPLGSSYAGVKVLNGSITGFNGQLQLIFVTLAVVERMRLSKQPGQNINFTNGVGLKAIVKHLSTEEFFSVSCPGTIVSESVAAGYLRQSSSTGCLFVNSIGSVI